MNKRIKKKLNNRLNIRHWKDAPNVNIITNNNKYHKHNNEFLLIVNGNPFIDEDDMILFDSRKN